MQRSPIILWISESKCANRTDSQLEYLINKPIWAAPNPLILDNRVTAGLPSKRKRQDWSQLQPKNQCCKTKKTWKMGSKPTPCLHCTALAHLVQLDVRWSVGINSPFVELVQHDRPDPLLVVLSEVVEVESHTAVWSLWLHRPRGCELMPL